MLGTEIAAVALAKRARILADFLPSNSAAIKPFEAVIARINGVDSGYSCDRRHLHRHVTTLDKAAVFTRFNHHRFTPHARKQSAISSSVFFPGE